MTDEQCEETCEFLKNHPLTMSAEKANDMNNPLVEAIS